MMETIGGGLAALGFWGFIAVVIVTGVWNDVKRRETQHETLRRIIESGNPVDKALMDKVLGVPKRLDRDLRIGSIVVLSLAAGLAVLGVFVSRLADEAFIGLLGAAALLVCLALGLFVASSYVGRTQAEDDASSRGLPKAR